MSLKNPTNYLPSPIQSLTLQEVYIFSKIPLHLLRGFANGTFRPNKEHRKKLTNISIPFYSWTEIEREAFIQKKKYRAIKRFISLKEKEELFCRPESYGKKLDPLIKKYWDDIVIAFTERDVESAPEC